MQLVQCFEGAYIRSFEISVMENLNKMYFFSDQKMSMENDSNHFPTTGSISG